VTRTPSVSVIIPTYQRRDQCVVAVASALAQSVPPLEVIVSDDGSVDGTREAIEALASTDSRVRYLVASSPSGRPALARNLAIDLARGDWIAFLDDDDEWLPQKLERQTPLLSGQDAVIASNARRTSGGAYFSSTEVRRPEWAEIVRDNPVIISSALVRRDVLVSAGGFRTSEKLVGIEDYCLWLDLAQSGVSFAILPEVLVVYCDTGNRLSSMPLAQQRRVVAYVAERWVRRPTDPQLSVGLAIQVLRTVKLEVRRASRLLAPRRITARRTR
jgi:teichuronic acid biosynthesis glycosyltransferase TuaG